MSFTNMKKNTQLKPEDSKELQAKLEKTKEENPLDETTNNICQVCYANPPDSVFMPCGHGAVCYECAVDIWKSSAECYLCRDEIEQILQVEVRKDKDGLEYLKVVASTQMVDEDEAEEEQEYMQYDGTDRMEPPVFPPEEATDQH